MVNLKNKFYIILCVVRGVFDQGENYDHKDEFGIGWVGGECLNLVLVGVEESV